MTTSPALHGYAGHGGVAPAQPTGQQHRRVDPEDLVDRVGPQRGIRAQPGELVGLLVQQRDAVAEQVDGGLEAGRQHQPGGGLELGVVEAHALLLDADELAHQVLARLRAQAAQVGVQPDLELAEPALDAPELAAGQAQVEARGGGGAELQHPLPVLGRDAEDLRDHGDRQLRAVRRHEVDGLGRVQRVEQVVGDLLGAGAEVLDGPGGEDAGDELAVAGVVGRLGDQQGRR